jgi:hypothetical protein
LLSAAATEVNTRRLSALNNLCSRDISRTTLSQKPTGRRSPTHTNAVATAIAAAAAAAVAAAVVASAEVATAIAVAAAAAGVAWQLQSSAPPRSSPLPTAGHSHKSHTSHVTQPTADTE